MSVNSKELNEKRRQFWKYHLKTWSESGLTQNAYCRDNNLKPNQLTYWKNKFKQRNFPVEFIQIQPVKIATTTNSKPREILRLNVDAGFQIEVPDGFSQTTLTQVLEVLRGI